MTDQQKKRPMIWFAWLVLLNMACMPDVAPTNPFDPETPAEQQKKASVIITVLISPENTEADPVYLPGVRVSVADGPSKIESESLSDDQGQVSLSDLVPGTYQLHLWHPQYGPPLPGRSHWITLNAGENKETSVYLAAVTVPNSAGQPTGYTLVGTAHKAGELAIPEADARDHSGIIVRLRTANEEPTSIETTTDRTGAFGLAVNPGEYTVYFNAPHHTETGPVLAVVMGGEQTQLPETIVLNINPGRIQGQVLREGHEVGQLVGTLVSVANTSLTAVSDEEGRFQITDVPAGTHTLRIAHAGYDSLDVPGVVVRGGQGTDIESILLKTSRGSVDGAFVLAGAQSSDGVAVQLTSTDGQHSYTTLTNSSGRYRFEQIPVGTYGIEACRQGYLPPIENANIEVTANVNLTLDDTVVNQPNLEFVDGPQMVTNTERYRLAFRVPTDRVKGIKILGDGVIREAQGERGGFVPFATEGESSFIDVELQGGDGPKVLQVQFRGDDCYRSALNQVVVNLDRVGPALLEARFQEGTHAAQQRVRLELIMFEADFLRIDGDDLVSINGDAANVGAWIPAAQILGFEFGPSDGQKAVRITARDAAGNESDSLAASIIIDTIAPQNARIEIDGGAQHVEEPSVTLTLHADGAHQMQIANDPSFVGALWEPYARLKAWRLSDPDEDGNKSVYVRFRDEAGNTTTVQDTVSDAVDLDRQGEIRLSVNLVGPDQVPITDVQILLDGENVGSPAADGSFVRDGIALGQHVITATLPRFYLVEPITVNIGPRRSSYAPDADPVLRLRYRTGTLIGHLDLADTDVCTDIRILVDSVESIANLDMALCQFSMDLPIGLHDIRVEREGFEAQAFVVQIESNDTSDLGDLVLARSRGTAVGRLELQGEVRHQGIVVSFENQTPPIGSEVPPNYTAVTLADGSFAREGIWAGRYAVFAEKEGYNRKSLGQINIRANSVTNVTGERPAIIGQQVGDFLINDGSAFTNDPNVIVTLTFSEIQSFQYRIDGGVFSEPIAWRDVDGDGAMIYGDNGEVRLSPIVGEDDLGDRIIEIRTLNLEGISSAEPYFRAIIRLDTRPPENMRIAITGNGVTVEGETTYSNSLLGEVTLDLAAEDLNEIARVRFSQQADCEQPFGPCPANERADQCGTQIYRPLMNYTVPDADQDGPREIWACFIDFAGNVSRPVGARLTLDRRVPDIRGIGILGVDGQVCLDGCVVNNSRIELMVREGFDPGVMPADTRALWVSRDDETFSTGAWVAYAPQAGTNTGRFTYDLPNVDGDYVLYFRARDAAQNMVLPNENPLLTKSIRLDSTPPPLPAVQHPQFVRVPDITVEFGNIAEARSIHWSFDEYFNDELPPRNPDAVVNFELENLVEGPQTLYVRYADAAGNFSLTRRIDFAYDNTAPTLESPRLNFGNTILAAPDGIPVEVNCNDGNNGAASNRLLLDIIQVIEGEGDSVIYSGNYAPLVTVSVANQDGAGTLNVRCSDPGGNVSAPRSVPFTLDTQDPTASLVIEPLEEFTIPGFTTSRSVNLLIAGGDGLGSGIRTMAVGNGNLDCENASYQPYLESYRWLLPVGEIEHQVTVCVKDGAGRTGQALASITLDSLPPQGAFSIPGSLERDGQIYVSTSFISVVTTLSVGEVPGENRVGIVIDGDECSQAAYGALGAFEPRQVELNGDGAHRITVCLQDRAGHVTPMSQRVILDTHDPILLGGGRINFGNEYLSDHGAIPLEVSCSDGDANVSDLRLLVTHDNGTVLYDGAYASLVTIDLPANAFGPQQLSVQCSDPAGRTSEPGLASYVYDPNPPEVNGENGSQLLINGGDTHTKNGAVSLSIIANDDLEGSGISSMAVANGTPQCNSLVYEPVREQLAWQLPGTDGVHTITVCIRDRAGNVASITDSVILDTAPPEGELIVPDGAYSIDTRINFQADTPTPVGVTMAYKLGFLDCNTLPEEGWLPFTNELQGVDSRREGRYELSLCLRDAAGNTKKFVETIEVDLRDPTGFLVVNQGARYATEQAVVVNVTASDDVSFMKMSNTGVRCNDEVGYIPLNLAHQHTLTDQDGESTIFGCLKKPSGRNIQLEPVTITLDRSLPSADVFRTGETGIKFLAEGGLINAAGTAVSLKASDQTTGVSEYKLSPNNTCVGGVWQPWLPDENGTQTVELELEAGDNVDREYSVLFRDAAGNESDTCHFDSIVIDTVPLTLTLFEIASNSGSARLTTSTEITVDLDHAGTGSCARYELSQNRGFLPEGTTAYEDCTAQQYTFSLSPGEGLRTVFARAIDTAGNRSDLLVAQIELDTLDPTLEAIAALPSRGADGPFSNSRDVRFRLTGVSGGSQIEYGAAIVGRDGEAANTLICDGTVFDGVQDLSNEFIISFASDGLKGVCVRVIDNAGNTSPTRLTTITIDTVAPTTAALDPANLNGVNKSCVNIVPSNVVEQNFWKFQFRHLGEDWTDSFTAGGEGITVELHQDSDNFIEVRAVDRAGNAGDANQTFVEEISSVFIPTNLEIKQICNGGQYAILKDKSMTDVSYRSKLGRDDINNVFVRLPEVALLDLANYGIRSLSPVISSNQVTDQGCNTAAFVQMPIDAVCSANADNPKLLVVSPDSQLGQAQCNPGDGEQLSLPIGTNRLWFYPNPIEQPLQLGGVIQNQILDAASFPDNEALAITSLDALSWTPGSNDFSVLATTAERYNKNVNENTIVTAKHRLIKLTGTAEDGGGLSYAHEVASTEMPLADGEPNYNRIRGLASYDLQRDAYLMWGGDRWKLYHHTHGGAGSVEINNFTDAPTTEFPSPYNVVAGPAHFDRFQETPEKSLVYLDDTGRAVGLLGDNVTSQELGTGAPLVGGNTWAPFFERTSMEANWLDAADERLLYVDSTYGEANTGQRYRFPMDGDKGVFPFKGGGGAGEPFVIYHTTGLNRGVVVGFRNERSCAGPANEDQEAGGADR